MNLIKGHYSYTRPIIKTCLLGYEKKYLICGINMGARDQNLIWKGRALGESSQY